MMNPLAVTGINLAVNLLQQAIAAGEITPEQVQTRIKAKQAEADQSEDRIDDLIDKGT